MILLSALPITLLYLLEAVAGHASPAALFPNPRSAAERRHAPLPAPRFADRTRLIRRDTAAAATNVSKTIVSLGLSEDGSSYYTLAKVGNLTYRIAIDTGSSDLWLVDSTCSTSTCKSTPRFPLAYYSSTYSSINDNQTYFDLSFADETTVSGFLASEAVQIGNLSYLTQTIGLANSTNTTLKSDISGVLGLGFSRLSTFTSSYANATPFVNGLAQRGVLDYPLFGIGLTDDGGGSFSLGAIDASVVQNVSAIEWHEVVPFSPFGVERNTSSYLSWVIELPYIGVNGTAIETNATYANITGTSLALIDVGTNGIFGPYQDVSRLFKAFNGSRLVNSNDGEWAIPCDSEDVMTFNFGGRNYTLQPSDYLIGPVSGDPDYCLSWPLATQDTGDGIDWQLGQPFLKTVYSIFSFGIDATEPPMIGFYPLSNTTTITQNSTFLSSYFSTHSATITTDLPNSLLSTPSASTTTYLFNTSVPASVGDLVSSELGTSTYSALLEEAGAQETGAGYNASAIPMITPPPSAVTLIVTNSAGEVSTTVEAMATSSIQLGLASGASRLSSPLSSLAINTFAAMALLYTCA